MFHAISFTVIASLNAIRTVR